MYFSWNSSCWLPSCSQKSWYCLVIKLIHACESSRENGYYTHKNPQINKELVCMLLTRPKWEGYRKHHEENLGKEAPPWEAGWPGAWTPSKWGASGPVCMQAVSHLQSSPVPLESLDHVDQTRKAFLMGTKSQGSLHIGCLSILPHPRGRHETVSLGSKNPDNNVLAQDYFFHLSTSEHLEILMT